MVLLPLDALSLAGTVVQFIDFTSKLISKGNEFQKSVDGALVENKDLKAVASNLQELSSGLDHVEKLDLGNVSPEGTSLKGIAATCEEIAKSFIKLIDGLEVKGSNTRWKSFRQAFKTIWKKEEIEAMLRRLSAAREQLVVNLLVVISIQSTQELPQLFDQNKRLEISLLQAIQHASHDVKNEVASLSNQLQMSSDQDRSNILKLWTDKNEAELSNISAKFLSQS